MLKDPKVTKGKTLSASARGPSFCNYVFPIPSFPHSHYIN